MKGLTQLLKNIISPFVFVFGFIYFLIFKKNYNFVYQAYVRTYCLSSGLISQIMSFILSINKERFQRIKKLKNMDVIYRLNENGYVILDEKLEDKLLLGLISLTKKLKCNYSKYDPDSQKVIFDEKLHKLPSYYYDSFDLVNSREVIEVINFLKKMDIADNYLKSKTYLIGVNMWWSTKSKTIDSYSAQDFHFDLDGIKWLKFFVYLNDVNLENGPHVYVEGTHKSFSKPHSILKNGYKRVKDDEIYKHFSKDKIHKIIGKKGTIIIGDSSCFHKGVMPIKGNRLIFEITLSNSLFANSPKKNYSLNKLYNSNIKYNHECN